MSNSFDPDETTKSSIVSGLDPSIFLRLAGYSKKITGNSLKSEDKYELFLLIDYKPFILLIEFFCEKFL